MGLFGGSANLFSKTVVAIANPISNLLKKGSGTATAESFKSSQVGGVLSKAGGLSFLGGSALLGAAAVTSAGGAAVVGGTALRVIPKVASAIMPKTVGQGAAAVVGAGVVASGAAPTIIKNLYKTGETAGQVIIGEKGLTADTVGDIVKTAGVVAGLGVIGTAAGYVASKVMDNSKEVQNQIPAALAAETIPAAPAAGVPITPTNPTTPETVTLKETPLNEGKIPTETRQGSKISQRVDINIKQNTRNNSPYRINKNYIRFKKYKK